MTDPVGDITKTETTRAPGPAEPVPAAGAASYYADEEDAGVPSPFVGPPDDEEGAAPAPVVADDDAEPPLALHLDPESASQPEPVAQEGEVGATFMSPSGGLQVVPEGDIHVAPTTVACDHSAAQPESQPAAIDTAPVEVKPADEPHPEPAPLPQAASRAPVPLASATADYVPADPRGDASTESETNAEVSPDAWDLLTAEPEAAPAAPPVGAAEEEDEPEPVVLEETEDGDEEAVKGAAPIAHAEEVEAGGDDDVGDGPALSSSAAPQLTYETLEADAVAAVVAGRADRWTIPLLCAGICLIACCVLIPAADANRRLAYEAQRLQLDLDSLRRQVEVNDRFLGKVADDPNLAERLAQRQLKIVRAGTKVLQLPDVGGDEMSPYHLVAVTPPPPMPAYQPKGGFIARLCYNPRSRLYLIGVGMLMIAAGLVMGAQSRK